MLVSFLLLLSGMASAAIFALIDCFYQSRKALRRPHPWWYYCDAEGDTKKDLFAISAWMYEEGGPYYFGDGADSFHE